MAEMNSISQRALLGDSMDPFLAYDDYDDFLEVESDLTIQIDPENSILTETELDFDDSYLLIE